MLEGSMFLSQYSTMPQTSHAMTNYQEQSLFPVLTATELLKQPRWQKLLKQIEQIVNIPADYYQQTYASLISNFAEFVQIIPAIEKGQLGGLLDEGLQRALLAIQLQLQSSTEPDPVDTYAVFSAALLVDLRKLLANKKIMISNAKGAFIAKWCPFKGSMMGLAGYYKIRPFRYPMGQLSPYLTLMLARQVMPEVGFLWLVENLRLFNMWLAALCGDEDSAGGVGHFLNLAKIRMRQTGQNSKFNMPVEIATPSETGLGEAFWQWLKKMLAEGAVNPSDPSVYLVEEGVFLKVPAIFQEFNNSNWKAVRDQFNALGIAEGDLNFNEKNQLFMYLNKDEIFSQNNNVQQKLNEMKDAKNVNNNFFATQREQDQREGTNRLHQWQMLVGRAWLSEASQKLNKLSVNKQLQELLVELRQTKKFAALEKYIPADTAAPKQGLQAKVK
jgi:hypothetical protein